MTDKIARMTRTALATVAASLLLPAGGALAQSTPSGRADVLMGDIVVTARKREEKAQDTPIAISAFSGASLEARGVARVDELAAFTPNLTFQNNPSFGGASASAAVYIRGIGQKEFLPTTEPGVGVYVDGVYVARSVGALLDLVDVERIEVLRGPQGTLFGRNTIGGAISVTTRKPDDALAGKVQATMGSDERIDIKAMLNLPLSDTLFAKVSAASFNRDGYVRRVSDGKKLGDDDTLTGRLDLRWLATDNVEVNVSIEGTRDRENGPALTMAGIDYGSAVFNPENLPMLPPASTPTGGFYVPNPPFDAPVDNFALLNNYIAFFLGGQPCLGFAPYDPQGAATPACFNDQYVLGRDGDAGTAPQYSRNDLWAASLTLDWDLDAVQLKSISAYRKLDGKFARDGDHSPLTITHFYDSLKQEQVSQEFQFLGENDAKTLKWIVGLYYFEETGNNVNLLDFTPVSFRSGGKFETRSYAAFGQATYALAERVDVTAGLRYTRDKKSFLPDQLIFVDRTPGAQLIAGSPNTPQERVLPYERVHMSEGEMTPMLNLSYKATDDALLYASFSRGFKSGGFVQRVFPPLAATPEFKSEKAAAYEAGFKSSWLDRRLKLNGALFYTKYDDLQVQVFTGVAPVTKNAAQAEIKGAELEVQASPGDGWFIEASVGYLDPRYKKIDAAATEITPSSRFERIAKWTLAASLSKSIDLETAGSLTARADWSYRSDFYMDALNTPQIRQPGYHLVNANVGWDSPSGRYGAALGVTNLFNEHYMLTGIYGSSFRVYEKLYARPREWYLTLKAAF